MAKKDYDAGTRLACIEQAVKLLTSGERDELATADEVVKTAAFFELFVNGTVVVKHPAPATTDES